MPGIGTVVNSLAIIAGGVLGLLLKKGIPERFKKIIFTANGTSVFLIGIVGVITASVTADGGGALSSSNLLILILSLTLGGICGEALKIDRAFDKAGDFLQSKLKPSENGGEAGKGFSAATILFCSGAMAIIGAIEDGSGAGAQILYSKAVIDGITACIFTTTFGFGVIFSSVSVFLYQGIITLLSVFLSQYLVGDVITQMSMVGSAVLMLLSFSLWDIKKFNVANLIPATFMPIIINAVISLFK